ncbi:hypothetical protein SUGI_1108500 [Cryptomeria japonica]|nr:hypothetical protein SUGI_1108500 [Cryptomeria japonica]
MEGELFVFKREDNGNFVFAGLPFVSFYTEDMSSDILTNSIAGLAHKMDENKYASLEITILNLKGHIWTMAFRRASMIYVNTVGDLGYTSDLVCSQNEM